jgi:hypothetical protein
LPGVTCAITIAAVSEPVVLFLGAGASRAFGYPLTKDILPLVADRLAGKTLFQLNIVPAVRGDDAKSINAWGFLNDAMAAFRHDLTNLLPTALEPQALRPPEDVTPLSVTDVLSLIDHLIASQNSPLPGFSIERLVRLRGQVQRAIATVVSTSMDKKTEAKESARLERLVSWLVARKKSGDAIITTNYDMVVEKPLALALAAPAQPPLQKPNIDYGCSWRDAATGQDVVRRRPETPDIALFKLHGSISWLHCELCDHVYINPIGSIFEGAYVSRFGPENKCACGHYPLSPLLVAPSMVRDIRNATLLSVWQSSLEALRRATRWVIIGYSLPPEDLAIRSMLIRAFRTAPKAPVVEVYEQGVQRTVTLRYQLLFGPNAQVSAGGMAQFVDGLARRGYRGKSAVVRRTSRRR